MHGSVWVFVGDPDELAAGYEALLAEVPAANLRFAACVRTPTGIVMVDTCASREDYEGFFARADVRALLARHGLGDPVSVVDGPVVAAFAGGARLA
jgi:hypothetical protein